MTDETIGPETEAMPAPDAGTAFGDASVPPAAKPESRQAEWLRQLQTMIDEVATQAGPVVRDVAAKAGELAQKAAEAAAPYAAKAADVTADVGQRIVDRSREVAADLRRSAAAVEDEGAPGAEAAGGQAGEDEGASGGAG